MTIDLEFMFEVRAQIGRPQAIGKTPGGIRTIMPVLGGTVKGPALNGEILPEAGADWALIRADGSIVLDVRSVIKAENGDLIYTSYGGRMCADNEAGKALALDMTKADPDAGKDQYYFRINPVYETASKTYGWLNNIIAVGTGQSGAGGVVYQIYRVK